MKVELSFTEVNTLKHLVEHAINLSQVHGTNAGTMKLITLRDKLNNSVPDTVSETVRQRDARKRASSFGFNGGQ